MLVFTLEPVGVNLGGALATGSVELSRLRSEPATPVEHRTDERVLLLCAWTTSIYSPEAVMGAAEAVMAAASTAIAAARRESMPVRGGLKRLRKVGREEEMRVGVEAVRALKVSF